MPASFASAIYIGKIRHRRFLPKLHAFDYDVFMMYLDTREIDTIFSLSRFWSLKKFAPVQFKRSDFHIDNNNFNQPCISTVDESVRNSVQAKTGSRPTGPVRMLVNLRYWGFNMNPLSTYYCFDDAGENVIAILAEVHNTPWNERRAYVLSGDNFANKQQINFTKDFHVSPFNPVDMDYRWYSTTPDKILALHLENWKDNRKVMDATLTLARQEITRASMNKILIRFPWMTVKVAAAIYWQALKLWSKRLPVFNHIRLDHNNCNHDNLNTCGASDADNTSPTSRPNNENMQLHVKIQKESKL